MTTINLSDDIVVPCPERGFALRKVAKCLACEFYMGLAQATCDGVPIEGAAADVYQVICGRPITRRLQKIVSD